MAACLTQGSTIVLAIINTIALMYFSFERNFFTRFLYRDKFIPFTDILRFFSFSAYAKKEVLFSKFDNQNIFIP